MEAAGVNWQELVAAILATGTPYALDLLKFLKDKVTDAQWPVKAWPVKWALAAAIGGIISALTATATGAADPQTLALAGAIIGAGTGVGYGKARNKPPKA